MSVWTHETSAFDAVGTCAYYATISTYTGIIGQGAWSPSLGLFGLVGQNCDASVAVISSPGNGIWTNRGNPWGQAKFGFGLGIDWSPTLNLFVAVGWNDDLSINVVTSPDLIVWTPRVSGCTFGDGVRWVPGAAKFWMVCNSGGGIPYTSANGIAWTAGTAATNLRLIDVAYHAGTWVGVGASTSLGAPPVATSTDGLNWTPRTSPMNGDLGVKVIWSDTLGLFVAVGRPVLGVAAMTSPDGITWTAKTGPWTDLATGLVDVGGYLAIAGPAPGPDHEIYYTSDLATYQTQVTPLDGATISPSLVYSPSLAHLIAFGQSNPAGVAVIGTTPAPPPPIRRSRFFEGFPWRFIFTDIHLDGSSGTPGGVTTTWACGLQTNRQIVKTLNEGTVITLDVWPDDKQVNIVNADGYPEIAQTKRLVYCFRREGGTPPWKIREAGIVMMPEDQGDTDVPLTHITAYDPRRLLEARPCLGTDGSPPGSAYGLQSRSFGLRGDEIITGALRYSIASPLGGFCCIDAGTANGGTGYYAGTIEATQQVSLVIQQGDSVADVWKAVMDAGNCDIVLTPIYDLRRPGYTHELNVYNLAGVDRPSSVFSWDKLNRSASNIDRLHDATPGNFSNVVQYFVGQGGPSAPLQINAASALDFGYWWATQFFPGQTIPSAEVVTVLAKQANYLSRQGKRTVVLHPTPERSPIPLNEYDLGDLVPVYATNRLRVPITSSFATDPPAAFRVEAIPITINDDGIETIEGLLLSPDWRTAQFS